MNMTSAQIRDAFLNYFESKQHQIVASSSLVPQDDPTLLFTNAGMNQFKDTFLGLEPRSYSRATSSQRCVRAGGKHNDLDNVGYTARHHTFFEMLGNFSFGDYFKQDAIDYAWDFLTRVLGLPKEKLLVTVYESDDEAFDFWVNRIGVPAERVIRIGDKSSDKPFESDNFWQMGDTGPCGPCTEIFYDHGEHIWGGPPGTPEEDGDRFIEIWNVVFMQFNRQSDGSMNPLPNPSVDTGMGLERIAAIMQGVHSNYEIDIFQHLIAGAAKLVGTEDLEQKSLRVIADHIRSCGFLIADGVMPSNEGRGYVLRRIIRRAVRHGHKLGAQDVFFYKLLGTLIEQMGEAYPELSSQRPVIEKVLRLEEEQFMKTLERGLQILDEELEGLDSKTIPGSIVFKLYDTYGFPADLTADIARERDFDIDQHGFDAAMAEQKARAKKASNFGTDYNDNLVIEGETKFLGYDSLDSSGTVAAIYVDGEPCDSIVAGNEALVVLDQSPFYAESGGQAGDSGEIEFAEGRFIVKDTTKVGKAYAHMGYVEAGAMQIGDSVKARVDSRQRWNTALNHSVTHLLHAALRETLGEHVTQKGSLVEANRLRFDFSHLEGLSFKTVHQIEHLVNQQIRRNNLIETQVMDLDSAKSAGAMALFGEKYDDDVRVVRMGDFSTELCGGTHAGRTGDIGFFKITNESGVAAGVRRIEAVTGQTAIDLIHRVGTELNDSAQLVKGDQFSLKEKLAQIIDRGRWMEKEIDRLKQELASHAGNQLLDNIQTINGVKVLIAAMDEVEVKTLRGTLDDLKVQIESGVVLLATVNGDKVNLIAGVTKDLVSKVKAGDIVNQAAPYIDGRGGGRPDMAQAGGTKPEGVVEALHAVKQWLSSQLSD
ncbi:alanine--tRNA ligase [Alginatibacterium sediminis]|uniref:Alanine--tRNA ligase n=1 Tax=Alginatibacterium sediminis TaxID=2164068 RepID=A0A420EA34_9ALTE|nr:alanine--tRNA ligase [Alginatibacterium sediminis]RKF17530.1 alanine--tRNA ligase [Alginatibacterium sediminis]